MPEASYNADMIDKTAIFTELTRRRASESAIIGHQFAPNVFKARKR